MVRSLRVSKVLSPKNPGKLFKILSRKYKTEFVLKDH